MPRKLSISWIFIESFIILSTRHIYVIIYYVSHVKYYIPPGQIMGFGAWCSYPFQYGGAGNNTRLISRVGLPKRIIL